MKRVQRLDYSTNGQLDPPVETPEGFLRVDGRISRVGIQEYVNQDGSIRRELRLPEDVFDAESLASFEGLPLTNDHPSGRVDTKNASELVVGSVLSPKPDGDYAKARIVIYDANAIAAARKGRSQLSCGYSCEVDEAQIPALVEQYGKYDSIQRKIRGNHVALVDRARAGAGASLRLDAAGDSVFCGAESAPVSSSQEKTAMFKLKVGKHTYDVQDGNIQATVDEAIAAEKTRADAAVASAETANSKFSALEAEHDKLAARIDADDDVKCDECHSSGKVDGDKPCPHCEGKGTLPKKADSYDRRLESRARSVTRGAKARADLMSTASKAGVVIKADWSDQEIKRQVARKFYARNASMVARLDGEKKNDAAYIEPLFQAAIDEAEVVARRAPITEDPPRGGEGGSTPAVEQHDAEDGESAYERQRKRRVDSEAKKKGA